MPKALTIIGLLADVVGFAVLFFRVDERHKENDDRIFWGKKPNNWEFTAYILILVGFLLQAWAALLK